MAPEKKTTTKAPRAKKPAKSAKEKADVKEMETEPIETTIDAASEEAVVAKGGSTLTAIGRRKTSIARVRMLKNGKGTITVNGRKMDEFFPTFETRNIVTSPLTTVGLDTAVDVSASVTGGGMRGQAEAVRLGISRALCDLNPTYRKTLKKLGFLTRDPRAKERKKPGLRRARRAPQWSKR